MKLHPRLNRINILQMDKNSQNSNEMQKHIEMQQNIALLEGIAKKKMTREAISRYGAVKLSHPENALKAILIIAQAVEQGMEDIIDDNKLKEIFREINKSMGK